MDEDNYSIRGDYQLIDLLKKIPFDYTDIITEFADVDIFLISLDSLLMELTSHDYHNWDLGGQTVVLSQQITRLLETLEQLNAKFKLIQFTDFTSIFLEDTIFSFLHSFMITFLMTSKWRGNVKEFKNPIDAEWKNYLHDLTPSFMLMSLESANKNYFKEVDCSKQLISIAVQLNTLAIPIVLFNSFKINYTSVMAYRMSIVPMEVRDLDEKIEQCWRIPENIVPDERKVCIVNVVDFWGIVVKELLDKGGKGEDFEKFCISVLIFAFTAKRMGTNRRYFTPSMDSKGASKALLEFRNKFLAEAKSLLHKMKLEFVENSVKFHIDDLWDGRLILDIYRKVSAGEKILPLRLQEEFVKLHQLCGLTTPVCPDDNDSLLDPANVTPDTPRKRLIEDNEIFAVSDELISSYMPEFKEIMSKNVIADHEVDYEQSYERMFGCQFKPLKDRFLKEEMRPPNPNSRDYKRYMYRRQKLSQWFQLFSDSLEGRGADLLVDFTRHPRLNPISEENYDENKPVSEGKSAKKGGGGGKKTAKEPQLSKKEQILKANADAMNKKQLERDKARIAFATQIKANAISALEELMKAMDLAESKALCAYEKALRYAEDFSDRLPTFENIERKREAALELVGALKTCFVKYQKYLTDQQKDKINYLWASLGFSKGVKKPDASMNLDIDFVYYQLCYAGRYIEVMSDPQKDERVSGFFPDAWQRRMLDAVDKDMSALIIAPTSAGKTFVSYYCIEKILRRSSEEVVVYISPSKALTNQVIGSVYARFRNKSMVGGRVLYGLITSERSDNATNCQVLVTTPDCFEQMLLSRDPECQKFVARIRYLILDEIHCLNDKSVSSVAQGHIWEHIFLLTRCPFLALSATVHNIDDLREWLQNAEKLKPVKGKPREVELITYEERWSELELHLQRIRECPTNASYENDDAVFRGRASSISSVASSALKDVEMVSENGDVQATPDLLTAVDDRSSSRMLSPTPLPTADEDLLLQFNPFGVYKLEKLRMFGIPMDQKLTARQILDFYNLLASVDSNIVTEFEPSAFFKKTLKVTETSFLWLNRDNLRELEFKLKSRFMQWLEKEPAKIKKVFDNLEAKMHDELEKRSKPLNMKRNALYNIVPLMDHLSKRSQIPALCFNDDRDICENLAVRLFNELQSRADKYTGSDEFKRKYNLKAEDKAEKMAKRKRDEEERQARRKKEKRKDEEGNVERHEKEDETMDTGFDQLALQKIRMREDLERFKIRGKCSDSEIYDRVIEDLQKQSHRQSTQRLLKLFDRGIGFHHDGLGNSERSAVEVLFRRGFLGIVFSTSTLALGMNLPCKTVVFGIDTQKLTPLQFRQMSGRAGRRGFDPAGNVIFMSLPTSKIRRLLTANLATLRGNVPYTTSFALRLLGFINGNPSPQSTATTPAKSAAQSKGKQSELVEFDTTNPAVRRKAALTLLQSPFVLYTRGEHSEAKKHCLQSLLKCLTFFNIQLLRKLQLVDEKCQLKGFANLAIYLSDYEPGNLIFVKLLQEGVFIRMLKRFEKEGESSQQIKDTIVNILAHIFTHKQLPFYNDFDEDQEKPILKDLPAEVRSGIDQYNEYVNRLFIGCLQLVSSSTSDDKPLLTPNPLIDPVFALTGKLELEKVEATSAHLVPIFDGNLPLDQSFVPCVQLKHRDHRGREIFLNSYAYDFWKLEAHKVKQGREMLLKHNRLLVSEMWYLINDFNKMLEAITDGLHEVGLGNLHSLFKEISEEFDEKFRKAFNMQPRRGTEPAE